MRLIQSLILAAVLAIPAASAQEGLPEHWSADLSGVWSMGNGYIYLYSNQMMKALGPDRSLADRSRDVEVRVRFPESLRGRQGGHSHEHSGSADRAEDRPENGAGHQPRMDVRGRSGYRMLETNGADKVQGMLRRGIQAGEDLPSLRNGAPG